MGTDWNELRTRQPFAEYTKQDSGCVSFGIELNGQRWFVKEYRSAGSQESFVRTRTLHAAVQHPAIVSPVGAVTEPTPTLIYPWIDGHVLNAATVDGSDRAGLVRLRDEPVTVAEAALDRIIEAHLAVAAAGFVAVDLYDGCFLYDFDGSAMWLIDLDEYRPGPFRVAAERLPGSLTYMAPEELTRGATIDQRTTVFNLGRAVHQLLANEDGWRGSAEQADLVARATAPTPADRYQTVDSLFRAWRSA